MFFWRCSLVTSTLSGPEKVEKSSDQSSATSALRDPRRRQRDEITLIVNAICSRLKKVSNGLN